MSTSKDRSENVILIAGPTASGKTGLAIELASRFGGIIINADSMQVYRELEIITARPSAAEMAACPHHLFGHVSVLEPYSVARWLGEAVALIEREMEAGRPVVIAGGTGLYFTSLLSGISPIPEIPDEIRSKWRTRQKSDAGGLYEALQKQDPDMADTLNPQDSQRIVRALEVVEATGISLLEWQRRGNKPLLPAEAKVRKLLLMPERAWLYDRINRRFEQMIEAGAIDEVKTFIELGVSESATASKAIGARQLASHVAGEIGLAEAIELSQTASRQYAKRQMTWFRNTFDDEWELFGTTSEVIGS